MEPQHVCVFKCSMLSLARSFHLHVSWLMSANPHSTELGQKFNCFFFSLREMILSISWNCEKSGQNQMRNFKPKFLRWKISTTDECVWIIDSMFVKNHLLYIHILILTNHICNHCFIIVWVTICFRFAFYVGFYLLIN